MTNSEPERATTLTVCSKMNKSKICIRFTVLFFANVSFYFNVVNTVDQVYLCEKSVQVSNGKCTPTNNGNKSLSHECTLACEKYYQVKPSISMVCGITKQWIGALPSCERVLCNKPNPPKNGRAKCASTNIANKYSSCILTCENQYKMSNEKNNKDQLTIQCYLDSNGNPTWDSFVSECKSSSLTPCKAPEINSPLEGNFNRNYVVTWCPPGYYLQGKSNITCVNNVWSDSMPKCIRNSTFPIVPQPCSKNQEKFCTSKKIIERKTKLTKIVEKCYDWIELYKRNISYVKTHYDLSEDTISFILKKNRTMDCILVAGIDEKYDGERNCNALCGITFKYQYQNASLKGFNVGNENVITTCICVKKHFYERKVNEKRN